jgi:DNA-binding transcriptional regulator YiaG
MLYLVDRLTRDVDCYFSVLGIYFAHTTERKILRMKFNEKLIEIRKKQGLSQEELGMELQVSRQTISKWETGVSQTKGY